MSEPMIIGNAAGVVKTMHDVNRICASSVLNRVTVGSLTLDERDGNTANTATGTYYFDPDTQTSINALGLNNMGIKAARWSLLPVATQLAHSHGKELWVSIAGFSAADYVKSAMFAADAEVDGIELNLGCPNIHDKGQHKPVFSEDAALCAEIFRGVMMLKRPGAMKIAAKISPVKGEVLSKLMRVINETGIVTEIVAVNTLGDMSLRKPCGSPALDFTPPNSTERKHRGGLAGRPLRGLAIETIKQVKREAAPGIRVIGAGGIFDGPSLDDFLKQGVAGFQCATAYLEHGPRIFEQIVMESELVH